MANSLYEVIETNHLSKKSLIELKTIIDKALQGVQLNIGDVTVDNTDIVNAIQQLENTLKSESDETQALITDLKTAQTTAQATLTSLQALLTSIDNKTLTQAQLDTSLVDIESLLTLIKDKPNGGSGIDYTTILNAIKLNTDKLSTIDVNVSDIEVVANDIKILVTEIKTSVDNFATNVDSDLNTLISNTDQLETLITQTNTTLSQVKSVLDNLDDKAFTKEELKVVLSDIESLLTLIKDKPSGGSGIDYTAKLNDIIQGITNVTTTLSEIESIADLIRITIENTDANLSAFKSDNKSQMSTLIENTNEIEPKLDIVSNFIGNIEGYTLNIQDYITGQRSYAFDELISDVDKIETNVEQLKNTTSNIEINSNDITSNVDTVMQLAYKLLRVANATQNTHQMVIDNQSDVNLGSLASVGNVVVSVVVSATAQNSTVVETGREPYTMCVGEVFSHGNGFSPLNLSGLVLNGSFVIRWEEREQIG